MWAIAGAINLVPFHVIKSLKLIGWLGTRRFDLRVPYLQMSCSDVMIRQGTSIVAEQWQPFDMTH